MNARLAKWSRVVAGSTLLVAGVSMLVLPGPGLVTIGFALALLQRDVPAARQLLDRFRERFPRVSFASRAAAPSGWTSAGREPTSG